MRGKKYAPVCAHVARLKMPVRCPLCLRCHGRPPGDVGGKVYLDAALAAAERERKMIQKLCKYGLIRAGTLESQLQSVATCRRAEPRDLQAYANAARATLPQGILLVHEEMCFAWCVPLIYIYVYIYMCI